MFFYLKLGFCIIFIATKKTKVFLSGFTKCCLLNETDCWRMQKNKFQEKSIILMKLYNASLKTHFFLFADGP